MKIWTDRKGSAHAKGRGDIDRQLQQLESIIVYAQIHAEKMRVTAGLALNTDPKQAEEIAILRAKNQELTKTLAAAERQLKGGNTPCSRQN